MEPQPPQTKTSAAGGCLIAIGIILGALYGMFIGHAVVALAIGAVAGIAAAVAIWLADRR